MIRVFALTLSFSVIKRSESRGSDFVSLVRSENETTTVSLSYKQVIRNLSP